MQRQYSSSCESKQVRQSLPDMSISYCIIVYEICPSKNIMISNLSGIDPIIAIFNIKLKAPNEVKCTKLIGDDVLILINIMFNLLEDFYIVV